MCGVRAACQAANWGGGHRETLARSLLGPLAALFHDTASGRRWLLRTIQVTSEATAEKGELSRAAHGPHVSVSHVALKLMCSALSGASHAARRRQGRGAWGR